jgi:predicted ribosome quality control (RQC) complex YloA/Tae2 family protein
MMDIPGPTTLIPFGAPEDILLEAASLCAAYSKAQDDQPVRVSVKSPGGSEVLTAQGGNPKKYHPYLI